MLNTKIKTIPHSHHRYPTVGDYYKDPDTGENLILISDMKNEKYEFLVAIHELIEEFLTRQRGITEEAITEFDKVFEELRQVGNIDEPGNSTLAPYYKEHQFATIVEKLVALELGVNWNDYEEAIIHLDEPSNSGC